MVSVYRGRIAQSQINNITLINSTFILASSAMKYIEAHNIIMGAKAINILTPVCLLNISSVYAIVRQAKLNVDIML